MCDRSSPPPDAPQASEDFQGKLVTALLDQQRYPRAAERGRLIETHISWVLLTKRYAYKIKKSIDLGFLNFTSLASRRYYCEEEIRLNRRLAPQLYLDVVPIGGTPEAPELGALPAFEYAVRMRRFVTSNELDRLAAHDRILPQHIDSLAATIAHFHEVVPRADAASSFGSARAIHSAVLQCFDRLQASLTDDGDVASVVAVRHCSETEYRRREEYFEQRRACGFVRECHGDLHLGNIALIGGKPVPFDGIEFSPELRWIDVMNEVAFTYMDLLHYKRPELAYRFLNGYLEATGDYGGVTLLPYYASYRAAVRAMVSAIQMRRAPLPTRAKGNALARCRSFVALALERLTRHRPALIITHGLPGSGKTTLAQDALERLQAIRVRSDVERKRLFGLAPLADSRAEGGSIYSASATKRTYGRLHDLARELLTAGNTVIVDAAFLRKNEREYFCQLAQGLGAPFAIASLQVSSATLRARIIGRRSSANDASEADLHVLEGLQEKQEVLSSGEQAYAVEFANEKEGFAADVHAWRKLDQLLSASPQ